MAKQVFESIDLVRRIYSFGDPSHRAFTDTLKWDLKAWPEVLYERFSERCLSHHSGYSFNEYLFEVSTEKIQHLNRTYLRCYCCARHNRDKRYLLKGNITKIVWRAQAVYENEVDSECDCKCRASNRVCTDHLYYREVLEE